jgi:hypothetical protein
MSKNYLNNRDMLREIHLSKNTYCAFADPATDHQYDVIVTNSRDISNTASLMTAVQAQIPTAIQNRADRVKRETGVDIDPLTVPLQDLVFRVMTWDHIPLAPPKVPKSTRVSKAAQLVEELDQDITDDDIDNDPVVIPLLDPTHVRVNFPPFQHFRIGSDQQLVCVGKSHWVGDLVTGQYSKTHGQMTETLALMFIKLCERYATRSNWRYYTYNDEMRGTALVQLSQIGLQFDESKSSNPFSYFTSSLNNSFLRILNIEKRNQAIRDDILEMNGMTPSFARQAKWFNKE